jgi:hypothetical protein
MGSAGGLQRSSTPQAAAATRDGQCSTHVCSTPHTLGHTSVLWYISFGFLRHVLWQLVCAAASACCWGEELYAAVQVAQMTCSTATFCPLVSRNSVRVVTLAMLSPAWQ